MEWPTEETTGVAMDVLQRAAEGGLVDIAEDRSTLAPAIDQFKRSLKNCENFRREYRAIIEEFTTIMASASSTQALDMAQAGIDALHDLLLFRIDDYTIVPAKDAFILTASFQKLKSIHIKGTKPGDRDVFRIGLTNPANLEETLYGLQACEQIGAWHKYGVLETSTAVLAKTALVSGTMPSIVHRKRFCLLGCTSELGPAKSLLLIPGAQILGVCREGKKLDDLVEYAQFNSPDTTKFSYPKGGADLLIQGPQIAQWILDQTSPEEEIVLMPLAYADGEENVRLCVAMDLIIQRVTRQRRNSILIQYSSPTQVMVLPATAASAAKDRLGNRPAWEKLTTSLTFGKWLQPSLPVSNNDYCILNGIATAQGPNFALAKTLQMWRCMIAYYRDELNVSAPFAPICRTQSVLANKSIATVLEGPMHHFEPMLAFDVGPASTLMAAVLVSQIQCVNRPLPDMEENPFTLFWDGSVHGGTWTCPYTLESILTVNWVLGKTYYPKGYIPEKALPPAKSKAKKPKKKDDLYDMFNESQYGKPMPECVRERLEFM